MDKAIVLTTVQNENDISIYNEIEFYKLIDSFSVIVETFHFAIDKHNNIIIHNEEILNSIIKQNKIKILIFNIELTPEQRFQLELEYNVKIYDLVLLYIHGWYVNATKNSTKQLIFDAETGYQYSYFKSVLNILEDSFVKEEKELIDDLNDKINEYEMSKYAIEIHQNKNSKRKGIKTVSIIGHSDTGKTTLFNELLNLYGKTKKSKDKLVTIDQKKAIIKFDDNKEVYLTDNICLYEYLPKELNEIYFSWLESAFDADMIIVVEDQHIFNESTGMWDFLENVLEHIEGLNLPIVFVINKVDEIDVTYDTLALNLPNLTFISAKNHLNFNVLEKHIKNYLFNDWKKYKLFIPSNEIDELYEILKIKNHILLETKLEFGLMLEVELSPNYYNKFKDYIWVDKN